MTERTKQEQAVVANLADAGCDKEQIEQFMDFLKSGRKEAGLSLLAKHRRFLLVSNCNLVRNLHIRYNTCKSFHIFRFLEC